MNTNITNNNHSNSSNKAVLSKGILTITDKDNNVLYATEVDEILISNDLQEGIQDVMDRNKRIKYKISRINGNDVW